MAKIFYINLEQEQARGLFMKDQLDKISLPYERIPAIDSSELTQQTIMQVHTPGQKLSEAMPPGQLSPGEVACYLSHISAWRKVVEENIDHAIILEDDAAFNLDFYQNLQNMEEWLPKKYDLIYYYHGKVKYKLGGTKLPPHYQVKKIRTPTRNSKRTVIGTVAYQVSYAGAKRLLEHALPICLPIDLFVGCLQYHRSKAYGMEPLCVSTGSFETSIKDR